ncbi:hypothetical protein SRHO_G00048120 [Serrasalmus rhombeus]
MEPPTIESTHVTAAGQEVVHLSEYHCSQGQITLRQEPPVRLQPARQSELSERKWTRKRRGGVTAAFQICNYKTEE